MSCFPDMFSTGAPLRVVVWADVLPLAREQIAQQLLLRGFVAG